MIGVSVNKSRVSVNLNNIMGMSPTGAGASLLEVGHEILRLSQQEVPHDKGTLQSSGTAVPKGVGSVEVGYHTVYAAYMHEGHWADGSHVISHYQKGRKGNYLEDPVLHNARQLGLKVEDSFGDQLKRMIR